MEHSRIEQPVIKQVLGFGVGKQMVSREIIIEHDPNSASDRERLDRKSPITTGKSKESRVNRGQCGIA